MDYITLGRNIRKFRLLRSMRQEDLAVQCNCGNSHIGQIENGRGIPSLEITTKIANALGVSVDQLIIADSKYPELIYLREISEKLQSYPLSTRILACEMIRDMLEVLDRAQFDNSHLK